MKNYLILLIVGASVICGVSCKKDEVSTSERSIRFTAESDVELNTICFIDRGREIVWQESKNSKNLDFTTRFALQAGDKVIIRSIPSDGQWHMVKTAIYVDGKKLEYKEKFCVAGTGCTHVFEP